jgi:hypothetical protein
MRDFETTDKHGWTQIIRFKLSVFISVHLWLRIKILGVVKLIEQSKREGNMYINFQNSNLKGDLFSGEYTGRFAVESKDTGHEGTIYFTNEKNGNGCIEWCRNGSTQGTGVKIGLEELINLLENKQPRV